MWYRDVVAVQRGNLAIVRSFRACGETAAELKLDMKLKLEEQKLRELGRDAQVFIDDPNDPEHGVHHQTLGQFIDGL